MQNLKKISIFILALIGFILTVKLAWIYFDANFNPYALSSFCSINDFIDCDGAARTVDSQFLGIPLAYWGMGLYVFVFLMIFIEKLKNIKLLKFLEVFKNPFAYISAITFIAFIIGLVLACISLFYIKKLCILCFMTYFINLAISIVSNEEKNIFMNFKIGFEDFISALKIKKYCITFIILSILAILFLTYTRVTYVFAPQVKIIKSVQHFLNMKENPYKVSGNILGDKDGKVVVEVYSDFVCPMCYANNLMIHKAAKEFKNIKFIHHNMPLDKECNSYINIQIHPNACLMSRYALAAENQERYWDLSAMLFELHPQSEEEILKIAKDLKFNTEKLQKDANSKEISDKLKQEIKEAFDKEIEGTPAFVIKSKKYIGVKPYFELVEIFEDAGAVKK